jgi:hypothetical protein
MTNAVRLDITATYGGKRYLMDISVSATQNRKIGTTVTNKVEAGMAATAGYKEKVVNGATKKLGDILQVGPRWWPLTRQVARLC